MERYTTGNTTILIVLALGAVSALTYLGLNANVMLGLPQADMSIVPHQVMVSPDETFSIDIIVSSNVAVNVFAGDISFDPSIVRIDKIDYNTSIADLWAELPWYHNGDGTLHFGGGTTEPGGFVGEGSLITITFRTLQTGSGSIVIEGARILQHDGLGTDVALTPSIDAIITITNDPETREIYYTKGTQASFLVTQNKRSTDLNGDGKQTIADLSIFMTSLATQNLRADFNEDGKVTIADLSILMNAK